FIEMPSWTSVAQSLLAFLSARKSRPNDGLSIEANLARPVGRFAISDKGTELARPLTDLLAPSAKRQLEKALTRRLAWSMRRIVAFEASMSRKKSGKGSLNLVSSEEFSTNGVEEATIELLLKYPALLRLWSVQIEGWRTFIQEFLQHSEEPGWFGSTRSRHG